MSNSTALRKQNSLMDSFGAVQAALSAMPEQVAKTSSDMADAFLQTDAVLSSLAKQKADIESQHRKLVRLYGANDAMVDAADLQRATVEQAYNLRLAALRRKRGEKDRATHGVRDTSELQGITHKKASDRLWIQREEERLLDLVKDQQKQKRRNDTLWLWAFLILGSFRNANYQQRPALRPI